VGVRVAVAVGDGVKVGVEACQVTGGAVTTIATLTSTVLELVAEIGCDMNGTRFGRIGLNW
jgi:hypothetical protein